MTPKFKVGERVKLVSQAKYVEYLNDPTRKNAIGGIGNDFHAGTFVTIIKVRNQPEQERVYYKIAEIHWSYAEEWFEKKEMKPRNLPAWF